MLDWVDNGFNCETISWQTRRLLNPLSLCESRLCPSPLLHQKRSPDCLVFEKKGKKSALLFCLWPTMGCHGTVSESLYASGWWTENEMTLGTVLDCQRRSILVQTLIHWRSWLKWLTSSHCSIPKWHTGWTQNFCRVIFFKFIYVSFFLSPFFLFVLFWGEFSHLQLKDI